MPIGDSITDDCSYVGAWRAPLQPLLDTNGFAFTNVGRLISSALSGFTKRRHEGYCGTVIASPGVFGPVYSYDQANNYLWKITRDALANTNNRPDLVLVLIGANDIGRGRNPYRVATNDMPALLEIIFSNAPNAHVLLAKTTTLLNATFGYSAYATNVPIYNAALQAMVNRRRALGQNVFLADMFSAVDYATMFNGDHLHPNPTGLRAIAKEWFERIQTITIRTNLYAATLINGGAVWKYSDTGQDLGTNWAQPDFDDAGWSEGPARLGYGDPTVATSVSYGPDATNKYPTTYFRRWFTVPEGVTITNLNFRLARAGGAAVWLNGQEMFRTNLPGGPIAYTNFALTATTGFAAHIFYPTNLAVTNLPAGTNLLAVELHQSSATNSTLGFDLELIATGVRRPPPSLGITPTSGNLALTWPQSNGAGYVLYSTTNLAATGNWTTVEATTETNAGQISVTLPQEEPAKFFRLQRP